MPALPVSGLFFAGLVRVVDMIDRHAGMGKVAITIIRRIADLGDYHRGRTNAVQMEYAPSHQTLDLMNIMPHVDAAGILVHASVTHGHIITVATMPKKQIGKADLLEMAAQHPRIRTVRCADDFLGNASCSVTRVIWASSAAIIMGSHFGMNPSFFHLLHFGEQFLVDNGVQRHTGVGNLRQTVDKAGD